MEEIKAIHEMGVYKWVELMLNDQKPIKSRFVFKTKYNEKGEVTRYKARLVACGYSQQYGVDYTETFALVAKFDSVRTMLAIAAYEDLELEQMDVVTAFLNGKLKNASLCIRPKASSHTLGAWAFCLRTSLKKI